MACSTGKEEKRLIKQHFLLQSRWICFNIESDIMIRFWNIKSRVHIHRQLIWNKKLASFHYIIVWYELFGSKANNKNASISNSSLITDRFLILISKGLYYSWMKTIGTWCLFIRVGKSDHLLHLAVCSRAFFSS